jgi:ubiquinone/menaquinone biosynthesis C-methylase UbiE
VTDEDDLLAVAKTIGDDWKSGPYYDQAEQAMDVEWQGLIWPFIKDCDFSCVVDLAAGHGRNSEKLRHLAKKVYAVDINEENIEFLRRRFAACRNMVFILNEGISLSGIANEEVTLVYSFDAMVHFDSDVVRAYLKEFHRVLKPGGHAFCHHSNFVDNPDGEFKHTDHWRNFMSRELFAHYAWKEGLEPVRAQLLDWDQTGRNIDCFTLVRKPGGGGGEARRSAC